MEKIENHIGNTLIKLFRIITIVIWSCLLVACNDLANNNSPVPIAIKTEISSQTIVSPTNNINDQIDPAGTLLVNSWNGIYSVDVTSKEISVVNEDELHLTTDIRMVDSWIYFLRTTDIKQQETPAGGQNGPADVYRLNISTEEISRITDDVFFDFNLTISPNNIYLAYTSDRPNSDGSKDRYKVIVYDQASQKEEIILEGENQFLPLWSPTGNKLAVLEVPFFNDQQATLFLFDVNQGFQGKSEYPVSARGFDWSPDGKSIVVGGVDQNSIDIINIDTNTVAPFGWFKNHPDIYGQGKVRVRVYPGGLTTENITYQTHIFHEGNVVRKGSQDWTGTWRVNTDGSGKNSTAFIALVNQFAGRAIFVEAVDEPMKAYIINKKVPAHLRGLGNLLINFQCEIEAWQSSQ